MDVRHAAQGAGLATAGEGAGKARIVWVDIARAVAICLVVLNHSLQAATSVGQVDGAISSVIAILGDMRMPVFFFCSGLLASWGLAKPWPTVLVNRGLVLVWVLVVWTLVYFAVGRIINGIPLWFIYAILFLSLTMRAVAPLPISGQIAAILGLNAAILVGVKLFGSQLYALDSNMGWLASNLARYALLYFAAGCWLAPAIMVLFQTRVRIIAVFAIALLAWLAELAMPYVLPGGFELPRMIGGIPAVLLCSAFAGLLSFWEPASGVIGSIGTRTLEIFLLHPIMLILASLLIVPLHITSGNFALVLLFGFAFLGSIAIERIMRRTGLQVLFRPPERVRAAARGLLARWSARHGGSSDAPMAANR